MNLSLEDYDPFSVNNSNNGNIEFVQMLNESLNWTLNFWNGSYGTYESFNGTLLGIMLDDEVEEWRKSKWRFSFEVTVLLISLYGIMIILGLISNISIIVLFVTKQVQLTTRNVLIVNLAVSDCFLCSITMPFACWDIVTMYFPINKSMEPLCKLVGALQSTCVFLSSFSILLIAIDRYLFLVHQRQGSNRRQISVKSAVMCSVFAMVMSVTCASPLFITTKIEALDENKCACYEDWDYEIPWKSIWNGFCFVVQLLIPSILVTRLYWSISAALKPNQEFISLRSPNESMRNITRRKTERRKKTNRALILVTLVFFLSWLPYNVFNLIFVVLEPLELFETDHTIMTYSFITVHFIGMTSVITNPLMYGLLNTNFRKALKTYFNITI